MNHSLMVDLGKNTEVTGVASGTKISNGVNTGEPCVVVYVPKKRPLSELKPNEIIPKKIDGKVVDVQESVFKALSLLPSPVRPAVAWQSGGSRTIQYRPAVGGISIGHYAVTAGTLGTVCANRSGRRVILSNNHVMANCNDCEIGDDIYQPGDYDGGTIADKIGGLYEYIEVLPEGGGATNEADAATALPTNDSDIDTPIADLTASVLNSKPATVGMNVTKSGRTTQVKEAVVSAIDAAIRVQYPNFIAAYVNQIMVGAGFVAGGDSGSACLERPEYGDPTDIVGLVFAGSTANGIICPIAPIITGLGIEFNNPVAVQGVVKRNGAVVPNARVVAYNLTDERFIGYVLSDINGAFSFPDAVSKNENVVIFAQFTVGSNEYGGFSRKSCAYTVNYLVINLSEYTPIPDGVFCGFKLLSGDFLNCDIVTERYYSNLF